MYTDFIHDLNPDIQVIGKACPLFVPLVEEGWLKDPVTEEVAGRYLEDMKHADVDTLILGCTHYPLLRSTVGKVMGDRVTLVNPAYETALELKELLRREGIAAVGTSGSAEEVWPEHRFFVSDLADKFKDFANSILACEISQIRQIPIENY